MSWEEHVVGVVASSYPKEAFQLAQQWSRLGQMFGAVADQLAELQRAPANSSPGWQGKAADAFVEHAKGVRDRARHLSMQANSVGASLQHCADALCAAISTIPVPLFADRDLPGGVDVEDLVLRGDGKRKLENQSGDVGSQFADRLRQDMTANWGQEYYNARGFLKRATKAFSTDMDRTSNGGGNPQANSAPGASMTSQAPDFLGWYGANEHTAETARTDLASVYRDAYRANLGVDGHLDGGTHLTDPDPDTLGGGPDTYGGGPGAGWPDTTSGPWSAGPSGPAGVTDGWTGPDFTSGLAGDTLGGSGSGPGWAGLGAGGLGGGVPGLVSPGSASGGPQRAPMPVLTDPRLGAAQLARTASGAGGGMGMMGGAGAGQGGLGEKERSGSTWLTEDDDVWGLGAGDDLPPPVLGAR